jgi:hypothetical protein
MYWGYSIPFGRGRYLVKKVLLEEVQKQGDRGREKGV